MKAYLEILHGIVMEGVRKPNRTGVDTFAIPGATFRHDMSEGFPLLTTKQVYWKGVASELEFFIKGLSDKAWLNERKNYIWNEWCNPEKVPYGNDEVTKDRMREEMDLGRIYGVQWRDFGGVDQLKKLVETLKMNPNDRRMLVSAWNPPELNQMALPPCHYAFQVTVIDGKLNLFWNQRSVDTPLGLPFNIASYALLLHLLAKEADLEEGVLTGFLADVHYYENQVEGIKEQLIRRPRKLPTVLTPEFTSIFDWEYTDTEVKNYNPHPRIKMPIAV